MQLLLLLLPLLRCTVFPTRSSSLRKWCPCLLGLGSLTQTLEPLTQTQMPRKRALQRLDWGAPLPWLLEMWRRVADRLRAPLPWLLKEMWQRVADRLHGRLKKMNGRPC